MVFHKNTNSLNGPLGKFSDQLLHIYLVLGTVVPLILIFPYYYLETTLHCIFLAIFALISGVMLWQNYSGMINYNKAANVLSGSLLVLINLGNYLGHDFVDNTPWLVLFPIIVYTLHQTRAGLYWSIAAIVTAPAVLIMGAENLSVVKISIIVMALVSATFVFHIYSHYIESGASELRSSKNKYQGIFNESVAAIYVFDKDKNFIDSNQAGLDLLGYSREELLNMSIPDVDADHGEVVPAHNQLLSGGRIVNFEHRLVHKDGHIVTVLNNSRPLTGIKDDITGMQSTLIDITERKQMEEALIASENQSSALLEAVPDSIFHTSREGIILHYTANSSDLYVPPPETIIGKTNRELLPLDIAELIDLNISKTLSTGGMQTFEYQLPIPERGLRDYEARMVKTGEDEVITIVRDVTERKRAEKEKEGLKRELEHSQKMESLGHLTGSIAHEFNNLLGIINGYTGLAVTKCINQGDKKLLEYMRSIETASGRATKLVSEMLAFGRSEQADDLPLNISSLILEDINMLRSTLPSTIEIETKIDPHLPSVLMNPTQLNQILMNLSINARDAMDGVGQLTIHLRWCHGLDTEDSVLHKPIKGDWIELSVNDTGSGIEPNIVKNIFNPFFTTKEVGKGTGMGLSIIYRIMEDHAGHILLDSEPGEGTTFRLLFPPIVNETTEDSDLIEELSEIPEGDGSEILVVDDEEMLAVYISEMVKNYGYKSHYVTDSTAALSLFTENPDRFSMLITDQTMPKMTGKELIEKLRAIRPELPVIMCSGYSEKINSDDASKLNFSYFNKPVDARSIMKEITNLLVLRN